MIQEPLIEILTQAAGEQVYFVNHNAARNMSNCLLVDVNRVSIYNRADEYQEFQCECNLIVRGHTSEPIIGQVSNVLRSALILNEEDEKRKIEVNTHIEEIAYIDGGLLEVSKPFTFYIKTAVNKCREELKHVRIEAKTN